MEGSTVNPRCACAGSVNNGVTSRPLIWHYRAIEFNMPKRCPSRSRESLVRQIRLIHQQPFKEVRSSFTSRSKASEVGGLLMRVHHFWDENITSGWYLSLPLTVMGSSFYDTAAAEAFFNILFIKYWGNSDQALRLPMNSWISINLPTLYIRTTVSFQPLMRPKTVWLRYTHLHQGRYTIYPIFVWQTS